jgi:hypothetical protein
VGDPEGGHGGGDIRRQSGRGSEAATKKTTTASRPTMGAPLETVVKKVTQTQPTETQHQVWVSSPLEIALCTIVRVGA